MIIKSNLSKIAHFNWLFKKYGFDNNVYVRCIFHFILSDNKQQKVIELVFQLFYGTKHIINQSEDH